MTHYILPNLPYMLGIAGHYIESHFVSYQHCLFGPEPSNVCLHITFFCDQQSNSCCICWTSRAHFVSYHQCLLEGEPADGGFHGVITLGPTNVANKCKKPIRTEHFISLASNIHRGEILCAWHLHGNIGGFGGLGGG